MASKTIIEINGRKYDASTGQIVKDVPGMTTKHVQPKVGVIDGFQKPNHKLSSSVSKTTTQSRNKIQKAQTLARNVVKKPTTTTQKKVVEPAKPKRELSVAESRRNLLNKTPVERLKRAEQTKQSPAVNRFAPTKNKQQPVVTPHLIVKKEVVQTQDIDSTPPLTTKAHHSQHPTKKQVFTHPLAGANAHLASAPKKRRIDQRVADTLRISSKAVGLAAACLAILVLASFFAYQRVPNISMRLAASKAGFAGTIPGDTPAGYSFNGPIDYSKDVITVTYTSNSDDRLFKIVQRPTNWNSEALLTNFVAGTKLRYQTYSDKGLTVYIMANNNAAWVNNNVWYSLSGNSTLSTEQILALAASM